MPSLESERRCVGTELEEGPGLSASEVTVSEWPTSVSEGVEVLRRSLFFLLLLQGEKSECCFLRGFHRGFSFVATSTWKKKKKKEKKKKKKI